MGKFSDYTPAVPADYDGDTTFLIQNPDGTTKLANLGGLKTFFCSTFCATKTISTVDVLQLNSTPIEIVPAPGAGLAIEVISASMKMVYGGIAYATNTRLEVKTAGATISQMQQTSLLAVTVSTIRKIPITDTGVVTDIALVANAALNISVSIGDPTAGNSDIQVFVLYRLIPV